MSAASVFLSAVLVGGFFLAGVCIGWVCDYLRLRREMRDAFRPEEKT